MKVHHIMICFSILYLQDRKSEVDAQTSAYGVKGGSLTVKCEFHTSGTWKIFCRDECKNENILVETTSDSDQQDRYSIQYDERYFFQNNVLSVTITDLTKSDAGWYKCGLAKTSQYSYIHFQVIVADAFLDGNSYPQRLYTEAGGSVSVACSFTYSRRLKYLCKGDCRGDNILVQTDDIRNKSGRYRIEYEEETLSGKIVSVTISQLEKSDSGSYRCYMSGYSVYYRDFEVFVKDAVVTSSSPPSTTKSSRRSSVFPETPTQPGQRRVKRTDVLLFVGRSLAAVVVLLSVALLVFCRRRASQKAKEPAQETEYATVRKTNHMDGRCGRPHVEINPATNQAVFTTSTRDDNFFAEPSSQNESEEDSSKLVHSEVQFGNRKFNSRNSSFRGNTEDVVYSMPRMAVSSREDQIYSNM